MLAYIGASTNNSLFAVMAYPEHRFLIFEELISRLKQKPHPVGIGVNLYSAVTDALGDSRLWSMLGYSYDSLKMCRQALHHLKMNLVNMTLPATLAYVADTVLFLNEQLAILSLLLNDPDLETLYLELIVVESLQDIFSQRIDNCREVPKLAKELGAMEVPYLNKQLATKSVNVLSDAEFMQIAEFLRQSENLGTVNNILIHYLGSLDNSKMKCLNVGGLAQAFLNGNVVASRTLALMFLNYNHFPVLGRL